MSGDPDQEYFSDGITDHTAGQPLEEPGDLRLARNSSYAYENQPIDVSRIGRELGARYILEGSVRRAGNRIRISAQLVEAEGRAHLWAERCDRKLTDLFAVQDEISCNIVGTVAPELLEAEMQRVRREDPRTLALGRVRCARSGILPALRVKTSPKLSGWRSRRRPWIPAQRVNLLLEPRYHGLCGSQKSRYLGCAQPRAFEQFHRLTHLGSGEHAIVR